MNVSHIYNVVTNIIAIGVQTLMVLVLILGHKKINKIIQILRS